MQSWLRKPLVGRSSSLRASPSAHLKCFDARQAASASRCCEGGWDPLPFSFPVPRDVCAPQRWLESVSHLRRALSKLAPPSKPKCGSPPWRASGAAMSMQGRAMRCWQLWNTPVPVHNPRTGETMRLRVEKPAQVEAPAAAAAALQGPSAPSHAVRHAQVWPPSEGSSLARRLSGIICAGSHMLSLRTTHASAGSVQRRHRSRCRPQKQKRRLLPLLYRLLVPPLPSAPGDSCTRPWLRRLNVGVRSRWIKLPSRWTCPHPRRLAPHQQPAEGSQAGRHDERQQLGGSGSALPRLLLLAATARRLWQLPHSA